MKTIYMETTLRIMSIDKHKEVQDLLEKGVVKEVEGYKYLVVCE